MGRRRPPRLPGALYLGVQRYSVTICCDERRAILNDEAARELVLSELRRTSQAQRFSVFVYCLMPDHVHLVVEGEADDSNCVAFVRLVKQTTAFHWKRQTAERLWQPSFYDHVLRDSESTKDAVRYLLENPVRANLAKSPADYPHAGSFVYDRRALMEWAFGWNRDDGGI